MMRTFAGFAFPTGRLAGRSLAMVIALVLAVFSTPGLQASETVSHKAPAAAKPAAVQPSKKAEPASGSAAAKAHVDPVDAEAEAETPAVLDSHGAEAPATPRSELARKVEGGWEDGPLEETLEVAGFRKLLEQARQDRRAGKLEDAEARYVGVLRSLASDDFKRPAMMELAITIEERGDASRAVQTFAQYIARFPRQPGVIEAYLRQGLAYRKMGASTLAISKFYAVMTSALSMRLDQMEYYKRLVLQAQIEIADTFYLEGRWSDAVDFLQRLLKTNSQYLDVAEVRFKLIRALAAQDKKSEAVGQARTFLDRHADSPDVAEVRFILATTLKQQGRNQDALEQVLRLLETQRSGAERDPRAWTYWQKRAGNEIANQLYREGDYLGTLEIYNRLVKLDDSAEWQLPVFYQVGLAYERLQQPAKALEAYKSVLSHEAEVSGARGTPSLKTVLDMARWRKSHLQWASNAVASASSIRQVSEPKETDLDHVPSQGNR